MCLGNSYITSHAAGFTRCSTELQDRMSAHINMLCSRINKGKAPKEVSSALSDLKDLMAFHQSASGTMGTALQHLVECSFVHLANLILLGHDAYLDHIKPGVEQDTWLHLRNYPVIPTKRRMGNLVGLQRKFLRFYLNSQTFQFTALPSGLATAPLEFTKVVKEVKLIAQTRGMRIHQYLDHWLLRAPCLVTCIQHTQTLLALCCEFGWVVNMQKSELIPQQVFNFFGYWFNLLTGQVLPTQER